MNAAGTPDAFDAIADPRRRSLLDLLSGAAAESASGWAGLPVGELVKKLRRPQPAVSKDLAVLRKAGLVSVTRAGRHRLYAVEGQAMRAVHEWVMQYERYWINQVDRIKARAESAARRGV